jgi:hypothetical protein
MTTDCRRRHALPRPVPAFGSTSISKATARPSSPMPASLALEGISSWDKLS